MLVRTKGAAYAAGRSWLLIKHRDEWSGALDIAEFAPRSVKSDGDLEDILAGDTPAIWTSNRPAKGGATGAMLSEIIEKAAALKAGRAASPRAGGQPASSRRLLGERERAGTTKKRKTGGAGRGAPATTPRQKGGKKPAARPTRIKR